MQALSARVKLTNKCQWISQSIVGYTFPYYHIFAYLHLLSPSIAQFSRNDDDRPVRLFLITIYIPPYTSMTC